MPCPLIRSCPRNPVDPLRVFLSPGTSVRRPHHDLLAAASGFLSFLPSGLLTLPASLASESSFDACCAFAPALHFGLLASALSHLDNRTLSDENLSFLDLRLSFLKLSPRPISISKLVCYHTYTADLSPGSPPGVLLPYRNGNLILEVSFTLRCFQRLSPPHFASLLCRWHDNSCTSGASIPVLSY